ncbi:MAG: type II toxin-antitoxin system HipA family toxin [Campylobacterota bacterium]|nr:type II toxin-antitoxin system HipA family toxin [Campylobacterota bacterium]
MKNLINEIDAYIYDKKIGTIIYHEGIIYFEYNKEFKQLNIEISPFKLNTKKIVGLYTNSDNTYLYRGMAGVFHDSLPDKYGMAFIDRYFEGKGLRVSDITLLHKLAFIGDRGMGAISYKPKEHQESADIQTIMAAKDAYENMKQILSSKGELDSIDKLMNIIDSVSPIGGGRPKMLINYNKDSNKIMFNNKKLNSGYKRAIIKFDEIYYENESMDFTKIEYLYMSMAKECGINIPKIVLYKEDSMHHLIIERFDRDKDDNKIHISTASALMHKDISIPKVTSYEELFALTFKICNNQTSLEELFRRMVFNALSFNYDDHAKNFSFIMSRDGEWNLSPAYDITYSKGLAREHITTINGKGKDYILEDFLLIAKKNLIKKSRAVDIIKEISNKMSAFENRANQIGINAELIQECKADIESQLELLFTSS